MKRERRGKANSNYKIAVGASRSISIVQLNSHTSTNKSHLLPAAHHLSPSAYTIKRAGANAKHSGAAKPTRRRRDDRAVYSSRRKRRCIASWPAFTLKQIYAPTRVVKLMSPLGRSRGETTKKILGTRLCASLRVLHVSRFSYLRHYGARLPDVKAAYARIRKTYGDRQTQEKHLAHTQ